MAHLMTARSSFLAFSALACALALAACGPVQPIPAPQPGPETCDNGIDDNGDGKTDCADPQCFRDAACSMGSVELCGNDLDDDHDLAVDCDDADCRDDPACNVPGTEAGDAACSDGQDNDGDQLVDCEDPSCATAQACQVPGKENCSNGADDDGDGFADCADPDCATHPSCKGPSTEMNCADGLDDDGDGQVDCADPDCTGNAACAPQDDGAPCSHDSQCKGGKCRTEVAAGSPGGMCSNAVSCSPAGQTGCNGGRCIEAGTFDYCAPKCTGASGCRPGYACLDPDGNVLTNNSYCVAMCTKDADCTATGQGPSYGCNLWSNYCEVKDKGLGKYGAPCTTNSQCETYLCSPPLSGSHPNGYCLGWCDVQSQICADDGVCVLDSNGDGIGKCADGCKTTADCRGRPYSCLPSDEGNICWCLELGAKCTSPTQCCTGNCFVGYCNP